MLRDYRKLGIGLCVMSCVVVLGLGILASTVPLFQSAKEAGKSHQTQRPSSRSKINRTSKTDALEVVNTTVKNGFAKVALKNISNKNVNGIQLAINGGIIQIEFLDAGAPENQKLMPGAIYEEMFAFNGSEPVEVAVLAVTFDDQTSSGKTSLANEIFDTRRGVKKQLVRFKALLTGALKSSDVDSISVLDRLRMQAQALPEGDSEDSGAKRMGQIQAKQYVIQEIDFLKEKNGHSSESRISADLLEIKGRHERKLRIIESSTKP